MDPTLDRIEVSPGTLEIEVGRQGMLSARAFDENDTEVMNVGQFDWTSAQPEYVEVDASGQGVTVRGLQERVDGGVTGQVRIDVRIHGRSQPVGTAFVVVQPVATIQVSPSPVVLRVGESAQVSATATISTGVQVTVPTTWSVGDATVATVASTAGAGTAMVMGLVPGSTTLKATMGTRSSESIPVGVQPVEPTYARNEFVTVVDAVSVDFDAAGNLYVGNTASSTGAFDAKVRKVTPEGVITEFGDLVADPNALIVDTEGVISTLGPDAVLVAGAYDSQYSNNHITEIRPDGSVTRPLIESAPPLLSNPSDLAFLPDGDLLVSNFGTSALSRVHRNAAGVLELSAFYQDTSGPNVLAAVVVLRDTVYIITGARKLIALDLNGQEIPGNLWPATETTTPTGLAVDVSVSGSFGGGLVVTGSDGRVWRTDPATRELKPLGDFVFATPLYGVGVSRADGVLYIIDKDGRIWKVTRE